MNNAHLLTRHVTLTQRQENFCVAVVSGATAADAYRQAYRSKGGRAKTIWEQASRLMKTPKVAARIAELRARIVEKVEIKAAAVLGELDIIRRSDVRHYTVDEKTGKLTLTPGAPETAWRAVASIKHKTRTRERKDGKTETTHEVELRLWSKPDAARMLGEHLQLFPQRHKILFGDVSKMSDEELERERAAVGLQ